MEKAMNSLLCSMAEQTVMKLKALGLTVASAESCTGGMFSSYLTGVSGVSDIYELGVTSYSSRIKNKILSVNSETLEAKGAVSKETAGQMAEGVRLLADSDIGVAVTGAAGPSGTEGHPAGYVFIALACKEKTVVKLLQIEPLSRDYVRMSAVKELFGLINQYTEEKTNG